MKRKLLATLVGTAMLSIATNGAMGQAVKAGAVSGDVVKIGVLTDMSGLYSDIGGQGSVEAAKMAVEDFGGKVLGKPIESRVGRPPEQGRHRANKAREWFDREGVDMITDALNSGVAIAVTKVAGEKKRILMDVGAASTRLTNEDCNPYTVHYAYDTYALANGTGQRRGEAGRQHLVLPHRRLRLRPFAREGHRRRGQGRRRQGARRGAPSAQCVGLFLVPAAGADLQGADHRPGQRRRRHHQLDQGRQRVRHHQEPEAWPGCWCSSTTSTAWG